MKFEDIKMNDWVMLDKIALSDDSGEIVRGFEKYFGAPVKITAIRSEKSSGTDTSFTINERFGIYFDDIDYLCTKDEYPEYYL